MINFHDTEHLAEVLKFAVHHTCADKLIERLQYLASYGNGDNICEVAKDFAPHSFEFLMKHPDGKPWFRGGLIYSGPGQRLDGSAPAFTVSLSHETGHNWSVHT